MVPLNESSRQCQIYSTANNNSKQDKTLENLLHSLCFVIYSRFVTTLVNPERVFNLTVNPKLNKLNSSWRISKALRFFSVI